MKNIFVASDHAGLNLKNYIFSYIAKLEEFISFTFIDLGPNNLIENEKVDYPDFAEKVAQKVSEEKGMGILICGSGQGMCIKANKYKKIRAALCLNEELSLLARKHNNANILCLGSKFVNKEMAKKIIKIFFNTSFEGGRHKVRIDKI